MQQKHEVSVFPSSLGLTTEHSGFVALISCQVLCQERPIPGAHAITFPPSPLAGITNQSHSLSSRTHISGSSLTQHSMQPLSINLRWQQRLNLVPVTGSPVELCFASLFMHLHPDWYIPAGYPKPQPWHLVSALLLTLLLPYLVLDVASLMPPEMQETETRIKEEQEGSKYKNVIIRQLAFIVCGQDSKFPKYISSLSSTVTPGSIYSHPFHFIWELKHLRG